MNKEDLTSIIASESMRLKHSGLGIASFSLSIVVVLIGMLTCITIYYAFVGWPVPEFVINNIYYVPVTALISLSSLGLGIAALFQADRKVIFAIIGIVLSAVVFLFFGLLTVIMSFIHM